MPPYTLDELLPRCLIALILPTTQLATPQHNTTRESAAAQPQAMHLDSTTIPQCPDLSKSLNCAAQVSAAAADAECTRACNPNLLLKARKEHTHTKHTPMLLGDSVHTCRHDPGSCSITPCSRIRYTNKNTNENASTCVQRSAAHAKLALQAQAEQQHHTKVVHTRDNHTHTHTNSCTCRQLDGVPPKLETAHSMQASIKKLLSVDLHTRCTSIACNQACNCQCAGQSCGCLHEGNCWDASDILCPHVITSPKLTCADRLC